MSFAERPSQEFVTENEESLDLAAHFASAEEGFPPLSTDVVVEDMDELLRSTNMSPEALEAYRVQQNPE